MNSADSYSDNDKIAVVYMVAIVAAAAVLLVMVLAFVRAMAVHMIGVIVIAMVATLVVMLISPIVHWNCCQATGVYSTIVESLVLVHHQHTSHCWSATYELAMG